MARHLADRELTPAATSHASDGFALATSDDEADIRALLRRVVMPGAVRLAFTREPDYFAGEGLAGAVDRALIHRTDGNVSGIARLSTTTLHRNGTPRRIGYLGELRIAPEARHTARMLRDGYAILRDYARADHTDGCFTSIAADNQRARRVLEHGRRFGLPLYTPIADLVTRLVPVGRATRAGSRDRALRDHGRGSGFDADREDHAVVDRDELTQFLSRHARAAHLSLTWDDDRWEALAAHGVGPRDFCIVRERGRLVATAAIWDQRDFRQSVICGYEGALRVSRPLVNMLARAGLAPSLPPPGTVLALASVLGASVDGHAHWSALWRALRASAAGRAIEWLAIARETRDPQLTALRLLGGAREYHTRLYDVRWPDAPAWPGAWGVQPFRPEVALL